MANLYLSGYFSFIYSKEATSTIFSSKTIAPSVMMLKLSSNVMQVNNLSKGTYHAKVKWSYEGKDYQVNQKIHIK